MKQINSVWLFLVMALGVYYLIFFLAFFTSLNSSSEPLLRDRFGTTVWHSSTPGGEAHIYCYYPGSKTGYSVEDGEYILKRVNVLTDCKDWQGAVIIHESPNLSEKDKFQG
jgi:hypothetical protein